MDVLSIQLTSQGYKRPNPQKFLCQGEEGRHEDTPQILLLYHSLVATSSHLIRLQVGGAEKAVRSLVMDADPEEGLSSPQGPTATATAFFKHPDSKAAAETAASTPQERGCYAGQLLTCGPCITIMQSISAPPCSLGKTGDGGDRTEM